MTDAGEIGKEIRKLERWTWCCEHVAELYTAAMVTLIVIFLIANENC